MSFGHDVLWSPIHSETCKDIMPRRNVECHHDSDSVQDRQMPSSSGKMIYFGNGIPNAEGVLRFTSEF